ncbi:MAG: hypothetical protein ACKVP0_15440 [Pirellulaceae bacterium]
MIELTQLQFQELTQPGAIAVDPRTKKEYVLIQKEDLERLQRVVEDDSARLMAPLLVDLDSEDWEDASAYKGKP